MDIVLSFRSSMFMRWDLTGVGNLQSSVFLKDRKASVSYCLPFITLAGHEEEEPSSWIFILWLCKPLLQIQCISDLSSKYHAIYMDLVDTLGCIQNLLFRDVPANAKEMKMITKWLRLFRRIILNGGLLTCGDIISTLDKRGFTDTGGSSCSLFEEHLVLFE